MLWKWQSRQRFDLRCGGLSQTVAIRPKADGPGIQGVTAGTVVFVDVMPHSLGST